MPIPTARPAQRHAEFGDAFEPLPGSFSQPLALRSHGHPFRSYNPDLGDGRGFLYAQVYDLADGRLLDPATKGSGRWPRPTARGFRPSPLPRPDARPCFRHMRS